MNTQEKELNPDVIKIGSIIRRKPPQPFADFHCYLVLSIDEVRYHGYRTGAETILTCLNDDGAIVSPVYIHKYNMDLFTIDGNEF